MTKRHFIALADAIREHNRLADSAFHGKDKFGYEHINRLADFCESQNQNFNRSRWLDYVAGRCGPNGGTK